MTMNGNPGVGYEQLEQEILLVNDVVAVAMLRGVADALIIRTAGTPKVILKEEIAQVGDSLN